MPQELEVWVYLAIYSEEMWAYSRS